MSKKDYYETLGLKKDATQDKIKKAYKKLAMKHHPDRNEGNAQSEETFKEINKAYEILSDPEKKAMYDQHGHAAFDSGGRQQPHPGHENPFSFDRHQRGNDIQYNLEITLEQAAAGVNMHIDVPTTVDCTVCHGSCSEPGTSPTTCTTCDGTGFTSVRHMHFLIQQPCHHCGGSGKHISTPCKSCNGRGRVRKSKRVAINIPAGADSNNTLRMGGQGEAGKNGTPAGDLYVTIFITPHTTFKREGVNLHCEVPISFGIAALGGEIEVPTLEGSARIVIPAETQTGKQFRLKGKGIVQLHGSMRGDLYCHVLVTTPKNLSDTQKEAMKAFLT